jgi:hypothetical protein
MMMFQVLALLAQAAAPACPADRQVIVGATPARIVLQAVSVPDGCRYTIYLNGMRQARTIDYSVSKAGDVGVPADMSQKLAPGSIVAQEWRRE